MLSGTHEREVVLVGSLDGVAAHLMDREAIVACTEKLSQHELLGEDTVRFVLQAQKYGAVSFAPAYTVRWSRPSPEQVVWETTDGNLHNSGSARLMQQGDRVVVQWSQSIGFELPVNAFLARTIKPMVDRVMGPSLAAYLDALVAKWPQSG